jgi:hypothetical protein
MSKTPRSPLASQTAPKANIEVPQQITPPALADGTIGFASGGGVSPKKVTAKPGK